MNRKYIENKYVLIAGVIGIVLGPLYDAIHIDRFTWFSCLIMLSLVVFGFFNEYKKQKK